MNDRSTPWWRSSAKVPLIVFLAIGAYFLWTEHRAHVIEFLPWTLLLACVGMHFFMHGGHGHGGGHDGGGHDHGKHVGGTPDKPDEGGTSR